MSEIPLGELVPETRDWNEGRGVDLASWIHCVGNYEQAIGYGEVFWPDFIVLDGCVFFSDVDEKNYREWLEHSGGRKRSVEWVLNHRHIIDLFKNTEDDPSWDQVAYFGRLLRDIWATKLARDFPDRRFIVAYDEENCECLIDLVVSFRQEGPEPAAEPPGFNPAIDSSLFEQDEIAWLDAMAELARDGRRELLDLPHLAEFLADMARRERREVESRLVMLLADLLKWDHQPDCRSASWRVKVIAQRQELKRLVGRGALRSHASEVLAEVYSEAVERAAAETHLPLETFPAGCPYTLDQLLSIELPEADA